MDYLLVHANQKNYVALEVVFVGGGKTYLYKAEVSDNWKVGDHAVVLVKDKPVDQQLCIVRVIIVHPNPLEALEPHLAYRWVVGKVDLSKMAGREQQQDMMIQHLRNWEVQRRTLELVENQKRMMAALPNGSQLYAEFEKLGTEPVQVSL